MGMFSVLLICLGVLLCRICAYQLAVGQQQSVTLKESTNLTHYISIRIPDLSTNSHLSFQLQNLKYDSYGQTKMNIVTPANQPISICTGVQSVACLIPIMSLSQQTATNIVISSNVAGTFKFITRWANYTTLDKEQIEIQLNNGIAKYYQIPITQSQQQNLRVLLEPSSRSTFGQFFAKTQLYLNKIYSSIDLWNGAQGLFLSKLELVGHKYLYLTVVGQRSAKYNLSYEMLTKDHHDLQIPQQVYESLTPFQKQVYHVKCDNLGSDEELVMSFQIYSGNLQALFYLDRQMKTVFKTKYFHYMGDSKFVFTKKQLKGANDLYFRVLSSEQKLIFKLNIFKVKQQQAELLLQNSYNFQSVLENKYLYFYLQTEQHKDQKAINVSVSLMNLLGSTKITCFIGSSKDLNCLPKCLQQKFKQLKDVKPSLIALKTQYKLSIPNKNLDMGSVILLKLQSKNLRKVAQQVTIQYHFQDSLRDLRQNYPLTEVIEKGQLKYYRHTPYDNSKSIRLCVSVISGNVGLMGSFLNPLQKKGGSMTGIKNCIYYPNKLIKKSIYASLYGIQKSKYSISIQAGQKQQVSMTPILETNQDVDYQVTIAPSNSYIFVLHPIYPNLRVVYNSSRPMSICFLSNQQNKTSCRPEFSREYEVAGQFYQKQQQQQRIVKMQVKNPSNSDSLQFKVKYHSGDYDHCQQKLLNKVYEQDISSNACFQFQLPSNQQSKVYQIMAKQLYYNPTNITLGICGKDKLKFKNKKVVQVKSSDISKYCNGSQYSIQLIVQAPANLQTTFKIQYIMQSVSQLIRLASNIRFQDKSIISESDPLRQYVISTGMESNIIIFMKQHTSLILTRLSVYLTNDVNYNAQTYHKLRPIASQNMSKDLEMTVVVLAIDVKRQCQQLAGITTSQCQVIVVVEPTQRKSIGEYLQYSIEFKSANRQLKQYQPQTSLLVQAGESDVFSFYPNLEQPMSAKYMGLVRLSTHNQQCARVYINRFDQPQRSSSLANATASTHLFTIDRNAYIIGVQAYAANCRYSLQVSVVQNRDDKKTKHLIMLHPQIHHDLNLSQDQVVYLIADVAALAKTRILYIRKLGDIRMYATLLNQQSQTKILKNQSYLFVQTDFSLAQEFPNILNLPSNQSNLFIIAVQAQSHSQGTLVLHNKNFPITVPHSKKIVDNISPSQKSILRFYTPSSKLQSGNVKIDLIYGKVELQASFIVDSNQKIIQVLPMSQSQCCSTAATNHIPFKFTGLKHPQYLQISIKNDQNAKDIAIFEVSIQLEENADDAEDIDKEAMANIQIFKNQKTLIKSKILSKKHKIIITMPQTHNDKRKQINEAQFPKQQSNQTNGTLVPKSNTILQCIQASIPTQYKQLILSPTKQIILDNVLILTVQWTKYIFKQSFDLLLELALSDQCPVDNLTVSVAPNLDERVSILTPFRWAYLKKQRDFAVASNKQFLIDIISCSGPVQLSLAKSFSSLFKSQQLEQGGTMLKNQPHVLKINPVLNQSISYFRLEAEQATIRYINPDLQKQIGIGYLKYQWNYFFYDTDFQKLTLYLEPIKNITQTKSQIFNLQYLVRIIGGIDPIRTSVQCIQVGQKTMYWKMVKGNKENKQIVLLISKEELLNQLDGNPQDLYISIDLIVSLLTPQGKIQNYKFLAPIQQIPVDIFEITRLSNKIIGFGILTIIAVIFGCIGLAECFVKYVVPFVGRIKWNNQLVQQDIGHSVEPHQSVPASSDRNQRPSTQLDNDKEPNAAVQTQQKMNS